MIINSAILIVAGAAFYYGPNDEGGDASIKSAHDLLGRYLGSAAAVLFALALLCVSHQCIPFKKAVKADMLSRLVKALPSRQHWLDKLSPRAS